LGRIVVYEELFPDWEKVDEVSDMTTTTVRARTVGWCPMEMDVGS
jgi:hypothetical protein